MDTNTSTNNPSAGMDETTRPPRSLRYHAADGAKAGRDLIDVVSHATNAKIIVSRLLQKLENDEKPTKKEISQLRTADTALGHIPSEVQRIVLSVIDVPHMMDAYKSNAVSDRTKMRNMAKVGMAVVEATKRLRGFIESVTKKKRSVDSSPATPDPPTKMSRSSSGRKIVPVITPPPLKSFESMLRQGRIGLQDVTSVLGRAADYQERCQLVRQLRCTGKVRIEGSIAVEDGVIWNAYCKATTPAPIGDMYSFGEIEKYLRPHVPTSIGRSFELAARIRALECSPLCALSGKSIRNGLKGKVAR